MLDPVLEISPATRRASPRGTSRTFAIAGARIVTVAGPPIESGVLVVRDGIIDSVGAAVEAPSDAALVDGAGLTVYPGLIDLGHAQLAEEPAPQPPADVKTLAELERWKRLQYLRPHARAADAVKAADTIVMKWAAAGVTSFLAVPAGEVLAGRSALLDAIPSSVQPPIGTIVEPPPSRVMNAAAALHVSLPARQRAGGIAYPASLMGVVAFVRQAFLDARHYGLEQGHERRSAVDEPPHDPALEAMQDALARRMPVAFEANAAREILRALRLARELRLDAIVTGGREAADVALDLAAQDVRVIYSLDFPQRSRSLAPGADEPLQRVRARVRAPAVPGELARAGVPFAFASGGLSDPKQFIANAARTVKAGLSRDAAVRALTIDAAVIAREQDRRGTIERGKLANLVVTTGELFDEATEVRQVFVHGRPVRPNQLHTVHPRGRS